MKSTRVQFVVLVLMKKYSSTILCIILALIKSTRVQFFVLALMKSTLGQIWYNTSTHEST